MRSAACFVKPSDYFKDPDSNVSLPAYIALSFSPLLMNWSSSKEKVSLSSVNSLNSRGRSLEPPIYSCSVRSTGDKLDFELASEMGGVSCSTEPLPCGILHYLQ